MDTKKDIRSAADIRQLVSTFYSRVQADPVIGPVFAGVIAGRWDRHLDIMNRFWGTILLEDHTYTGNPFSKHANMRIGQQHFQSWLLLWRATVDELFSGPKADEAKWRAGKMAIVFLSKLEDQRNTGMIPIV